MLLSFLIKGVGMMSTLNKPKFKKLTYSSFGGAPLVKSLWDRFDLSLLMAQSGMHKKSGVPTWQLAFLMVIGLLAQCSSCSKTVEFYSKEPLLQAMFSQKRVTQSVLSRFMVSAFRWELFHLKRVRQFQLDEETKLVDGDVIALDDTLVVHEHAAKMPFLYRLFDHCTNTYVKAMNLVVIHARKANGLQYPLFYSIWNKEQENKVHLTKLDLALQMLQALKKQLPRPVRLCVAMDSWYFVKSLYLEIEKLEFDWVTKARKNTLLYRKVTIRGKERFIEILPEVLFKEAKPLFIFWRKKKSVCMAFKDIYIKIDEIHNGQGYLKKPILKPISAVVTANLQEDLEQKSTKETFALLLSNNIGFTAVEVVQNYKRRWSIEVFFRNAKQELGLNDCHSTNKNHIHAHLSILFMAESLVRFAQWKYHQKTDIKEEITHGQVVDLLFHIRCEVHAKSKDLIQVYFDTTAKPFATFFREFWPPQLRMSWFSMDCNQDWNVFPQSG